MRKYFNWLAISVCLCLFSSVSSAAEGCISGDCTNGQGVFISGNYSYSGLWQNGIPNGRGVFINDKGEYNGEFKNGLRDGQGTFRFKNGDVYSTFNSNRYINY